MRMPAPKPATPSTHMGEPGMSRTGTTGACPMSDGEPDMDMGMGMSDMELVVATAWEEGEAMGMGWLAVGEEEV